MRALVMLKGFANQPILEADVQIPKLPLSENLTVVFREHVHERSVDYSTGLLEHPASNVERQREPAARSSRIMLDLIEGRDDLLATHCIYQRNGIVGRE